MITKRTQLAYLGQQINPSSPQAQGLVGMWALNDGAGTVARDLVGMNNGTKTGTTSITSPLGNAVSFNGTSDIIDISASKQYVQTTPWSIVLRFSITTYSGPLLVFAAGSTAYQITPSYGSNYEGINIGSTEGTYAKRKTGTILSLSKWYHLAICFDGVSTSSDSSYSLYIDAVKQTLSTNGNYLAFSGINRIGRGAYGSFYAGKVSDVRIYNRALSASEVRDMYVNPLGIYQQIYKQIYFPETALSSPYTRMLMGVGL